MDTDEIGLVALIAAVVAVLGLTALFPAVCVISAKVNKLGSSID
jgi:hypothetical protein